MKEYFSDSSFAPPHVFVTPPPPQTSCLSHTLDQRRASQFTSIVSFKIVSLLPIVFVRSPCAHFSSPFYQLVVGDELSGHHGDLHHSPIFPGKNVSVGHHCRLSICTHFDWL